MKRAGVSMSTSRPSLPELRRVCQPPDLLSRRSAEHWAGRLYGRKVSIYLTLLGVRVGLHANAVTGAMILAGLGGAAAFSQPGLGWAIAGALLVQTYLVLDCSDGEIARWTGTTSAAGIYLDRLGHYLVEAGLFVALGLRAGGWGDQGWTLLGLTAALLHVLGKAETDLVDVARAKFGLRALQDDALSASPRGSRLGLARRLAGLLPLHRLTGAVEASVLLLAAAAADRVLESTGVTRGLAVGLVAVAAYVVAGHLVMVLASSRLRA